MFSSIKFIRYLLLRPTEGLLLPNITAFGSFGLAHVKSSSGPVVVSYTGCDNFSSPGGQTGTADGTERELMRTRRTRAPRSPRSTGYIFKRGAPTDVRTAAVGPCRARNRRCRRDPNAYAATQRETRISVS